MRHRSAPATVLIFAAFLGLMAITAMGSSPGFLNAWTGQLAEAAILIIYGR